MSLYRSESDPRAVSVIGAVWHLSVVWVRGNNWWETGSLQRDDCVSSVWVSFLSPECLRAAHVLCCLIFLRAISTVRGMSSAHLGAFLPVLCFVLFPSFFFFLPLWSCLFHLSLCFLFRVTLTISWCPSLKITKWVYVLISNILSPYNDGFLLW